MVPTLDEILAIQENRTEFSNLQKQLQLNNLMLFIGAGLSCPCGLPDWGTFLRQAARVAGIAEQVESLLHRGAYEEAAENLLTALPGDRFDRLLRNAFGRTELLVSGPVLQLPRIYRGPVFTTNYDYVLERVFGEKLVGIVWGARLKALSVAVNKRAPYLVKLHGDAIDPDARILTRSDYQKHYGEVGNAAGTNLRFDPSLPLPIALTRIFRRQFLFLGCSLKYDRSVDILNACASDPFRSLPNDETQCRRPHCDPDRPRSLGERAQPVHASERCPK